MRAVGEACFGGRSEVQFGTCCIFKMSIGHPSRDVGYMSLEFKENMWVGDINLGAISAYMVFKS